MSNVDWHAQGVPAAAVSDVLAQMPRLHELLVTVPTDGSNRASWLREALAGCSVKLEILRLSGTLLVQTGAAYAHSGLRGAGEGAGGPAVGAAGSTIEHARANDSEDDEAVAGHDAERTVSNTIVRLKPETEGSGSGTSMREEPQTANSPLADMLVSVGIARFTSLRMLAICDALTPGLSAAAGLADTVRAVHHSEIVVTMHDVHGAIVFWDEHNDDLMALHERYAT